MGLIGFLTSFVSRAGKHKSQLAKVPAFDSDEMTARAAAEEQDAGADCFIIDYTDANGQPSTRRISVRQRKGNLLNCYCFERMDTRTFRIDRIASFYDLDGVLIDPPPYTAEPERTFVQPAKPSNEFELAARKREVLPELIVLRSLALSDGRAHADENTVIADFILQRMLNAGLQPSIEQRREINRWVRNFIPAPDLLHFAVSHLARRSHRELIELVDVSKNVVRADGVVKKSEAEELRRFAEALKNARSTA